MSPLTIGTGNGRVFLDGVDPTPIGGTVHQAAAGVLTLMSFTPQKNPNDSVPPDGVYALDCSVVALDNVTGDIVADAVIFPVTRFGGVSTVGTPVVYATTRTGVLAPATVAAVVNADGSTIDVKVDSTVADSVDWRGTGSTNAQPTFLSP